SVKLIDHEKNNLQLFYKAVIFNPSRMSVESNFLEFNSFKNPAQVILNWKKLHEKYNKSLDIFLALLTNPPKFLEYKFLFMAQTLESFHRMSDYKQKKLSKSELKKLKKFIRDSLNDSKFSPHTENVDQCLAHFDDVNLRERIKDLISEIVNFLPNTFADEFIGKFITTRNEITHVVGTNQELTFRQDLYSLTRKAEGIACLLIMNQLFEKEEFKDYANHRKIKYLINGG
ncbi:hypothetical protein SCM07_12395, partial [Legionella pneumophila serogroup 1]